MLELRVVGMVVPESVAQVIKTLQASGYEAYLVGGAVRDLLLGLAPKDWDVVTSALPEAVCALFPHVLLTGVRFGTVTVIEGGCPVEVTTYRAEGRYNGHYPGEIRFGVTLEEDLSRRDFTINAIAYDPIVGIFVDPCRGMGDLLGERAVIRFVGFPAERIAEDPLRILRTFYMQARLDAAGKKNYVSASSLAAIVDILSDRPEIFDSISAERIRDELNKILLGPDPRRYFSCMLASGVLDLILPEVVNLHDVAQGKRHCLDAFGHTMLVLNHVPSELHLRWAALLHDIGKALTLTVGADGEIHFYGHEHVGAEMAGRVLERLRFPVQFRERVVHVIKQHMFQRPATRAGFRRLARRCGGYLDDVLALKRADILGSGNPATDTRAFDEFVSELFGVLSENPPLGYRELAVDGHDVMEALGIGSGPPVGQALDFLIECVIDDPSLNRPEVLLKLLKERFM
ncbi:MAG: CCA tRNA nucleotidyltransferase [Bacillota bacterium]